MEHSNSKYRNVYESHISRVSYVEGFFYVQKINGMHSGREEHKIWRIKGRIPPYSRGVVFILKSFLLTNDERK